VGGTPAAHPAQLVVIAFALAVAVGTALLLLPAARRGSGGATLLEALFTATSAVCVTGLTVVDTGSHLSGFGSSSPVASATSSASVELHRLCGGAGRGGQAEVFHVEGAKTEPTRQRRIARSVDALREGRARTTAPVLPCVLGGARMLHDRARTFRMEPVRRCPVTTVVGDEDRHADRWPWRRLTTGGFREQVVAGDHFCLRERPPSGLLLDAVLSGFR